MAVSQTYDKTESRKVTRLPLYGNHTSRTASTEKDQRYINCFPETTKNSVTDLKKFFLVKRPGTSTIYANTAGASRGIWTWGDFLIYVIDNTVYAYNAVTSTYFGVVGTLTTSTGQVGGTLINDVFGEYVEVYGQEVLFICDGTCGYIIEKYPIGGTYGIRLSNVEKALLRWTASTILEVGDKRIPTSTPTYYYTVSSISGSTAKTGSSEPNWPTSVGSTVVDGDITWTCSSSYVGALKWTTGTKTIGSFITPTTENSLYYKVTTGGTATAEPTWPTVIGETITQNGVVYECFGYYGGFPAPHVSTPVTLDGYLCLAESNSVDIYNSWINNPYSWNPLDFISAESFSDSITGLARQNNYIVAFGESTTEMFYDNAYESGSPFARNESFMLQVGLASPSSIMQTEKICTWVGKSDSGGYSVWTLDGFSPKEISTEVIERVLKTEADGTNIFGYGIRVSGHFFYVLICNTKTFVYDFVEGLWHEWQYDDVNFPFIYCTTKENKVFLLHKTSGVLALLSETNVTDIEASIKVSIQTTKYDMESSKRKFIHKTEVVGDNQTTGTLSLSWSDDDYTTFNTPKILQLQTRPYFMKCGATRRRAFKIEHTEDTALRLEFLELTYTIGEH